MRLSASTAITASPMLERVIWSRCRSRSRSAVRWRTWASKSALAARRSCSACLRSVRSRVTLVKPTSWPARLRRAVMTTLAQNCVPSLRTRLYLRNDREATLRQLHRVLHTFAMPAFHLLADSRQRAAVIESLHLFDERTFFEEVYQVMLAALGVDRSELRRCAA